MAAAGILLSQSFGFWRHGGHILYSFVFSTTLRGIEGRVVKVEVDLSGGLPGLEVVGMPDASCREARHRVRSAIRNSGFHVPPQRITVNLAPAAVYKEGPQMDLAIALGLLTSSGQVSPWNASSTVFLGELALDGRLLPVRGVLPMALAAQEDGFQTVIVPRENGEEAALVESLRVGVVDRLHEAAGFVSGAHQPEWVKPSASRHGSVRCDVNLQDIAGQPIAKRALEVAAAGNHNVLLVGPPGSGKTLMARAVPGLLPPLSIQESVEVTKIASIAGLLPEGEGLITRRPFRSPHHTATTAALIGGGAHPRPGEVTLATHGVLFLDELPEFHPQVLNSLRQPLEEGTVVISRSRETFRFPAKFMLIAAMNPCPCGFYGDDLTDCTCSEHARRQYAGRISGPFRDRLDMHLEVRRVTYEDLEGITGEPSDRVRDRVEAAVRRQEARLDTVGKTRNSEMSPRDLGLLVQFSGDARALLAQAFKSTGMTARAYYRTMRVAVTVADLSGSPRVEEEHVAEALSYRDRG